jgi:hypothetical protein
MDYITHTSSTTETECRAILRGGLIVLCLSAGLCAMYLFGLKISHQWQGMYSADAPIYWTVGRGLLHHLMPYRDLFETKPPGIFFLSAISFWLCGSYALTSVFQAVALALLPAGILLAVNRQCRRLELRRRLPFLFLGGLIGVMLSVYVTDRSGGFQVESFGCLCTVLYASVLSWNEQPLGRLRVGLAAACLLGVALLKEPFILSGFAVALLLVPTVRGLWRGFFLPASLALTAEITLLTLVSEVRAYLTIYLPYMFGHHIGMLGSPWQRGLSPRMFQDLWQFSPTLTMAIGIFAVGSLAATLARATCAQAMQTTVAWAVACYALSLAVGLGGTYLDHHFVFAVPGYVAVLLAFLGAAASPRHDWGHALALRLAFGAALIGALSLPAVTDHAAMAKNRAELALDATVAQRIDAVLNACHLQRYLFIGKHSHAAYALTQHSPEGPLFVEASLLQTTGFFHQSFERNLDHAHLVMITRHSHLTRGDQHYIAEHYSRSPWPCAAEVGLPPSGRYIFLFRQ